MLVDVWRPVRGTVRLDATLDQRSSEALGQHVGYVPQDVELFNGTVAQNIARFEDPPDPSAVIAAAQAAGVQITAVRSRPDRRSVSRLRAPFIASHSSLC